MAAIEAEALRRTCTTHTGTLRRKTKEIEAVRGVSFVIEPGELFGLLGPNGAVIFGFLLIFTGANVPLDDLPSWMSTAAQGMPFTHAIEAARDLADGSTLADVPVLVGAELLIGVIYGVAGYLLWRWLEIQSRRHATLDRS